MGNQLPHEQTPIADLSRSKYMTANLPTRPKCPECEHGHLVPFTRDEELDFDLGEEIIKVLAKNVPLERCDTCGLIASGPPAAKVRHEAVCRAAGLLTPSEIKAIRERFGWSQQYLADLTGCGVATVSRWERGRLLQNRSSNKVLQAIRDCPPFREYLEGLLASKASKPDAGLASVNRVFGCERVFPRIKVETYASVEFSLWN
jgi:putative zinc finger/helix-turn-helix YgiT family protein